MCRCRWIGFCAYAFVAVFLLTLMAWPPALGAKELGCVPVTEDAIVKLFVEWNNALQTGNPDKVVALYALDGILLPTVENGPLVGRDEIRPYFVHFLENKPNGEIDKRIIRLGCNVALDAGLYTFTYAACPQPPQPADPNCPATVKARFTYLYEYQGGQWLIAHHHSSKQPK